MPAEPPSVGAMPALDRCPRRSSPRTTDSPCQSTAPGTCTETSCRSRGASRSSSSASRPTKSSAFFRETAKPEPRCERVVDRADVVAPRTEPALDARRVERERPRVPQPQRGARLDDVLVQVGHELGRHAQLPAELAGERHAEGPRASPRDVDLLRREERPRVVREVLVGEPGEQLARRGSGQVQGRPPARDVGDGRVGRQPRAQQHLRVPLREGGRQHEEPVLAQPRHGGVHLDAAARVAQHACRRCDPPRRRGSRSRAAAARRARPGPARGTSRRSTGRRARRPRGSRAPRRAPPGTTTAHRTNV